MLFWILISCMEILVDIQGDDFRHEDFLQILKIYFCRPLFHEIIVISKLNFLFISSKILRFKNKGTTGFKVISDLFIEISHNLKYTKIVPTQLRNKELTHFIIMFQTSPCPTQFLCPIVKWCSTVQKE